MPGKHAEALVALGWAALAFATVGAGTTRPLRLWYAACFGGLVAIAYVVGYHRGDREIRIYDP